MFKQLYSLLIGFVLGAALMYALIFLHFTSPPFTPKLKPATKIRITPLPWEGMTVNDCQPIDIPPEKLDLAYRLLIPGKYYGSTVSDHVTRVMAEAEVTHADGTKTLVIVRDGGVNPAMVSLDGHTYFYGRNDPDIKAGGWQLFGLLNEVHRMKSNSAAESTREPETK